MSGSPSTFRSGIARLSQRGRNQFRSPVNSSRPQLDHSVCPIKRRAELIQDEPLEVLSADPVAAAYQDGDARPRVSVVAALEPASSTWSGDVQDRAREDVALILVDFLVLLATEQRRPGMLKGDLGHAVDTALVGYRGLDTVQRRPSPGGLGAEVVLAVLEEPRNARDELAVRACPVGTSLISRQVWS
jgi:hypothetical protein